MGMSKDAPAKPEDLTEFSLPKNVALTPSTSQNPH